MKISNLRKIFNQFEIESAFVKATELKSGHINDTFLIETAGGSFYVLQRINPFVFKDITNLTRNKIFVSNHLQSKFYDLPTVDIRRRVLVFANTKSGSQLYKDDEGNCWNLSFYIENCVSYKKTPNAGIAFETGKIFGNFLYLTKDIDISQLVEILPNFHTMSYRFRQFDSALATAENSRKKQALDLIDFVYSLRNEMHMLENLVDENKMPFRLIHGDAKISNTLFSLDGKALCVIDTDTVMKGIIHYDFGDAVRTVCNNAYESEKKLHKVTFNLEFYKAFVKGFIGSLKNNISKLEMGYLAFSAKMMTFIVGLRMLSDFLNNDKYFKTNYELHNLNRAKTQMKLVREIEKHYEEMNKIILAEYNNFDR